MVYNANKCSAECNNAAEVTLSNLPFCLVHFHEMACNRVAEYRTRLLAITATESERAASLTVLSELITHTRNLLAGAKFLNESQRDQFHELSVSAIDLSKRIQHPRQRVEVPIELYRVSDPRQVCESTRTMNISKRGACIAIKISWGVGETIWIENRELQRRALARTVWVSKTASASGVMGIQILDWEDFWSQGRSLAAETLERG
jgi:hypothetical protein